MRVLERTLSAIGLLALLARWTAATEWSYYDEYSLYSLGYHYDYEGFLQGPYDDTYFSEPAVVCTSEDGATPIFAGLQPCDLVLEGADTLLSGLKGGMDGLYKVWSCTNKMALYKRESSPEHEDRILWFSSTFRDWEIANGTQPTDDILAFGGDGSSSQPEDSSGSWSIATDFLKEDKSLGEFTKFGLKLSCSDNPKPETT